METENKETSRLWLKAITPTLIHEKFRTKSKAEIIQFFGIDENGFEHLKTMHEKGMETHRISLFYFLLIQKDTKLPIGDCGFHTLNITHRRTELFYNIYNNENKNKGYMKEALFAVLKYGFDHLNLHRIQACLADWNTPSKKLVQHFGFVKEGTLREDYCVNGVNEDSDCYSLLKWEWESRQFEE
jgi:ribosomal-protein-alanine N-acetyltransferase